MFRILKAVAFVTYKEWAAYRSHMLLTIVIGPAFFLAQRFIWSAVYGGHAVVAGFTLDGMLGYYGVSTLVYYLTMDFADWNLQMHIRTGSFLTFMLRPLSHRFYALSQKVGHRALGFLFEFLPVWLMFAFVFRITLIPAYWLWGILSVALAFLMMFLLNYSTGILAFWLVRTNGIRALAVFFRDVLAGAIVPLSLFPLPVQLVMFCLPFQFASYVPVRVLLGHYELAGISMGLPAIVGLQAVAVLLMWLVTELLWRAGVRRYTGVGA
jgi:ABC-2 type transport system permease protein